MMPSVSSVTVQLVSIFSYLRSEVGKGRRMHTLENLSIYVICDLFEFVTTDVPRHIQQNLPFCVLFPLHFAVNTFFSATKNQGNH
mmetsp:Transcript_32072/g.85580  ORF Transcript_32072/g.85580 Transcript_32072/m.85580 type:complete len:85 (+) Transcript_32072:72-326(+)